MFLSNVPSLLPSRALTHLSPAHLSTPLSPKPQYLPWESIMINTFLCLASVRPCHPFGISSVIEPFLSSAGSVCVGLWGCWREVRVCVGVSFTFVDVLQCFPELSSDECVSVLLCGCISFLPVNIPLKIACWRIILYIRSLMNIRNIESFIG